METNNKIIAEFMGCENPDGWKLTPSPYEVDWNWLMEVVKKIKIYYNSTSSLNDTQIRELINLIKKLDKEFTTWEIRIKDVYNACLEFIKWYNENHL